MSEILELSNWEFKITMINMLRALNEKNRQHVRTDGWCKQINGKPKKESQKHARDLKRTV